jgi:hypothetical protein
MKRLRLIYAGREISSKNKIIHRYIYENDFKKYLLFKTKLESNHSLGNIISINETEEGYFQGPITYEGNCDNLVLLSELQVKDKAAYLTYENMKNMKNLPELKYDKAVKDLKEVLSCLPRNQRKTLIIKTMLELGD